MALYDTISGLKTTDKMFICKGSKKPNRLFTIDTYNSLNPPIYPNYTLNIPPAYQNKK